MRIKNQEFNNETIKLDDNSFDHCTFNNCKMIYSGTGPVNLSNSTISNAEWTFEGPAANTMTFLKVITEGLGDGGKELLLNSFEGLREYVLEQANADKH